MSRQSPALGGDRVAAAGYRDLGRGRLQEILESLRRLNILIVGDACLDVYWHADMKLSVLSRETPHFPLPVVEERFSPGACSNVAACLSALEVNSVKLLTVIGQDWRGRELVEQCKNHGIDTSLVISSSARVTPAYCKPLRKGISDVIYEDPRIDFENRSALPEELEAELASHLREAAAEADAIECLAAIGLDPRTRLGSSGPDRGLAHARSAARTLSRQTGAPVCMTLGAGGSIWADASDSTWVAGVPVTPPVDTVGAGDCFLSALTAGLAARCSSVEAMRLANLASAVVVKKLGTTGTATPKEILDRHEALSASPALGQEEVSPQ